MPRSPCSFLWGFSSTYPRLGEWLHPLYSGSRRTRFPDGDGPRWWSCMAGVVAFVRGIGNLVLIMSRLWLLRNKSRRHFVWGNNRGVALSWFGCGVRGYRSGARKCRYHVALVPTPGMILWLHQAGTCLRPRRRCFLLSGEGGIAADFRLELLWVVF